MAWFKATKARAHTLLFANASIQADENTQAQEKNKVRCTLGQKMERYPHMYLLLCPEGELLNRNYNTQSPSLFIGPLHC